MEKLVFVRNWVIFTSKVQLQVCAVTKFYFIPEAQILIQFLVVCHHWLHAYKRRNTGTILKELPVCTFLPLLGWVRVSHTL